MSRNRLDLPSSSQHCSKRPPAKHCQREYSSAQGSDTEHSGAVEETDPDLPDRHHPEGELADRIHAPGQLTHRDDAGCNLTEGDHPRSELSDRNDAVGFQAGVEYLHQQKKVTLLVNSREFGRAFPFILFVPLWALPAAIAKVTESTVNGYIPASPVPVAKMVGREA